MGVGKAGSLEKYITAASNSIAYIAMGALFVMMSFGTGDVLGRYFFSKPIKGTFELFEILLVVVVLLSLARAQWRDEHVKMTILWTRLTPRIQRIIGLATSVLLMCFFGIATWQGIEIVFKYFHDGRLISNLMVPKYIPQIAAPIATLVLAVVLGAQAFILLTEIRKEG